MNSINTVVDIINLNECIQSICNSISSILKDLKEYILQDTKQYFKDYHANYNQLQSILESYEEFNREDIALYRVNKHIDYIFKNKKLTHELVYFINNVWRLFADLIELKLDSMNDSNDFSNKDYEVKYRQYRSKIRKYEHYYYVNIYQSTCECEDLAAQIGNILIDGLF